MHIEEAARTNVIVARLSENELVRFLTGSGSRGGE